MHPRLLSAILIGLAALSVPAPAQDEIPWVEGPSEVELGDGLATLDLPAGYLFADAETTVELMERMGNVPSGQELGLVVPASEESSWFVVFEFDPVGYVEDDDKDEIDADELFESIRKGTEAANEYREENGFTAIHVTNWTIEPHYDATTHNLEWALAADDEDGSRVVNFNQRLLGRRGVVSVTLVTDPATFDAEKSELAGLVGGFAFRPGSRYGDFVAGDKIATYGLTALVAGGAGAAAAKLGLFALLGKFLGKAWKLVVLAVVGAGGALKRLFRRDGSVTMPGG